MAKVKAAIRKNEVNKDNKVNVKLRIFHNGKTRYLGTDIYVEAKYFLSTPGRYSKTHPFAAHFNSEIKKKELALENRILKIENIDSLDISTVMRKLQRSESSLVNIFDILRQIAKEYEGKGTSTSQIYANTILKLERFVKIDFLDLREIDNGFLRRYNQYLLDKVGNQVNTAAIDLRNIRTAFNRAIDDGLIGLEHYPFRKFKIEKEKTVSRALNIEFVRFLYHTKQVKPKYQFAIDVFFLSFFFLGINMKDLYNLKRTDVVEGRLVFNRAKTGRSYSILIHPLAAELIKKYKDKTRLFNFYHDYCAHKVFTKTINKYLIRIGKAKGLTINLTTYFARHSWATIAGNNGITKDVIRLALGHGEETTTDIYIDYDLTLVDEANKKVIDLIVKSSPPDKAQFSENVILSNPGISE